VVEVSNAHDGRIFAEEATRGSITPKIGTPAAESFLLGAKNKIASRSFDEQRCLLSISRLLDHNDTQ
jgi:hypothetical protein